MQPEAFISIEEMGSEKKVVFRCELLRRKHFKDDKDHMGLEICFYNCPIKPNIRKKK